MENGEWNGVGFGPQYVEIHHLLNIKNRKITQENGRAQKKLKQPVAAGDTRPQHGRATPTMSRGENQGQPMVVSGPAVPPFLERCVLVLLFGPRVLPWIFRLGLNWPLLQPSLTHLASTSSFSPITLLDICKSGIKNLE